MELRNNELKKEMENLKKKLLEENNKNNNLFKINQQLENELKKEKQGIQENKNNINEDKETKIELYKRIDDLKEKLSRYPIDLSEREKLLSVIFSSEEHDFHYSIICKNTEKFNKLEDKLYHEYPKYSETDIYFTLNGKIINRFQSLEENNIQNSDVIIINKRND